MTASERATQIWSVLALAASNRRVLTYDILAQLTGVARQGLGQLLEPIQSYCLLNGLPPLTILVVRKDNGLPGSGFSPTNEIPANQLRVFEFDWRTHGCPGPERFGDAASQRPSNAGRDPQ